MFKKTFVGMATSLALSLSSTASMAATEIEFLQWFAAESAAPFYEGLVSEFEAENPDIKVKLITQPFGKMRESIITNRAIGVGSDILGVNMPWTKEFLDLNVLAPLDDYLAAETSFNVEDLVQAPVGKINGHSWMVPLNAFPFVMHYNKDLLSQAGFDAPPANWDELKTIAAAISKLGDGISGLGLPFSSQPPANGPVLVFLPLLYTAGGRTTEGTTPNFDNPEVVTTLTLLKELNDLGAVAPGSSSRSGGVDLEEFIAGRTGFLISPAVHANSIQSRNPDLAYGIAPIAQLNTAAYRVHGWELALAADSKHKDEAWKFIAFLLEKEVNARVSTATGALPGNLKALDVAAASTDPILAAQIDVLANHEPVEELRQSPKAVASWSVMTEEIQKMLVGDQTPAETASVVQARWLELIK